MQPYSIFLFIKIAGSGVLFFRVELVSYSRLFVDIFLKCLFVDITTKTFSDYLFNIIFDSLIHFFPCFAKNLNEPNQTNSTKPYKLIRLFAGPGGPGNYVLPHAPFYFWRG